MRPYWTRTATILAACFLTTWLGAGNARADFLSFTVDLGPTRTNFSGVGLALPQFDDFGGARQLEEATISFSGTLESTASFTFVTTDTTITVNVNNGTIALAAPQGRSLEVTGLSLSSTANSNGVTTFPFSPPDQTKSISGMATPVVYSSPAELLPFVGTGTVAVVASGSAVSSFTSSSGNGLGRATTFASGVATITYRFTPIPEPASVVLMGVGGVVLVGLVARRRMRRRSV